MIKSLILSVALLSCTAVTQAATITYDLDNVVRDTGAQLTGNFTWTYVEGDFENGTGTFNEIFIPGFGTDLSQLNTTIDIPSSIEITLLGNIDSAGVDITLFFDTPLNELTPTPINLIDSKYSLEVGVQRGVYVSGQIAPRTVPIPAAVWLFGSGLLGLIIVSRRKTTS